MSELTSATLIEDLRALAQKLLEDPVAGPIVSSAGVGRALTDEEERAVLEVAEASPFLSHFEHPGSDLKMAGHFINPKVALGLARQVSDGLLGSVNTPEASALIERNMVMPSPAGESPHDREQRVPFALYHKIMVNFTKHPDFDRLRRAWVEDEEGDPKHRKSAACNWLALEEQQRFGELANVDYVSIANAMQINGQDIEDPKVVWDKWQELLTWQRANGGDPERSPFIEDSWEEVQ